MPSPPISSNPIDETLSATDRNRDNSVRHTNVIARTARQAADRARQAADRAHEEVTEAQRVTQRQRLPRPVSRRNRNELRRPNFNIFENSPKYTLKSYQRTRSDEIYVSLEHYDHKIENLAHDIDICNKDIQELTKQIRDKKEWIKKYEKEKASILKFNDTIITTLTSGNLPDCTICLGNIPKNNVAITRCRHLFCKHCISAVLGFSNRCPICRTNCNYRDITIINLEDTTSPEPNQCVVNQNNEDEKMNVIGEDQKEQTPESHMNTIIQTPPPPPPRRTIQTQHNTYEYNIQGITRFSGSGGSRGGGSRGGGSSSGGSRGGGSRGGGSRGGGSSGGGSRGGGSGSGGSRGGGSRGRSIRQTQSSNNRLSVSPTRRIDYNLYRVWSQVDERNNNNSREYGRVGIGSSWNTDSYDLSVPDRDNFLRNRPPILPPINAADYPRPPRTPPRTPLNESDNQYSAYINQPRVNQYRRNRNEYSS